MYNMENIIVLVYGPKKTGKNNKLKEIICWILFFSYIPN